jgi:hypothetical protein
MGRSASRLLILSSTFLISRTLLPGEPPLLELTKTVPLPGVEGRMDHLSVDPELKRLFLAALGNGTLEVISLEEGKVVGRIEGLKEPQGVLAIPGEKEVVVASGGDGTVRVYDAKTLSLRHRVDLGEDADNVRWDPRTKRVYVGYGAGALGVLEQGSYRRAGDIKLKGHPESFQLEVRGPRIFVNVPQAGQVAVVDREKGEVVATWPVEGAGANFPMAIDEERRRLFLGCRKPPKLVVLDLDSGKPAASVEISGDTDDLFYDSSRRRIYFSCGEGTIDILDQVDADHYRSAAKLSTREGARTSLFASDLRQFFLAVPARPGKPAELRIYSVR